MSNGQWCGYGLVDSSRIDDMMQFEQPNGVLVLVPGNE